MTRIDWLRTIRKTIEETGFKPSIEGNTALYEALLQVAATMYATTHKVGVDHVEKLANAAYHALQDKAEEVRDRN